MKVKLICASLCVCLCLFSGAIGAYFMVLLQEHRADKSTLQVRRLEIVDAQKEVRAVLATESDGSVFLRMLSRNNVPRVELGMNGVSNDAPTGTPSAHLTISDNNTRPVIVLEVRKKDHGTLSFSSAHSFDQVSVGYWPADDTVDEHDRARWGILIRGANHETRGIGAYSEDGIVQGFTSPLVPPTPLPPQPRQ